MANIKFKYEKLFYKGDMIYSFDWPIEEVVGVKNLIIVLLSSDCYKKDNENVFCLDFKGNLLWQIPKMKDTTEERNPYVGLIKEDERSIWATNWSGNAYLLDLESGKVLKSKWEKKKKLNSIFKPSFGMVFL